MAKSLISVTRTTPDNKMQSRQAASSVITTVTKPDRYFDQVSVSHNGLPDAEVEVWTDSVFLWRGTFEDLKEALNAHHLAKVKDEEQ